MRSCRLLQCCETPAEERSAGNPHATFCGNWRRATASSDPVERCGVAVEAGPMQRFGAKGAGTSVYFRDPDGSLMEFMS
jgi:catechol 2,3-dioxygenase-like lactoylglutathione lyase family enzyme